MDNKTKLNAFTVNGKISIIAQVGAHIGTCRTGVTVGTLSVHVEYSCEKL